jgi:hypothetical protein
MLTAMCNDADELGGLSWSGHNITFDARWTFGKFKSPLSHNPGEDLGTSAVIVDL